MQNSKEASGKSYGIGNVKVIREGWLAPTGILFISKLSFSIFLFYSPFSFSVFPFHVCMLSYIKPLSDTFLAFPPIFTFYKQDDENVLFSILSKFYVINKLRRPRDRFQLEVNELGLRLLTDLIHLTRLLLGRVDIFTTGSMEDMFDVLSSFKLNNLIRI